MIDCDYCDATFEDEAAYLDHLAGSHEDELSRIDRRRVEERGDDGGLSTGPLVLGVVVVLAAAVALYVVVFAGGTGNDDGAAAAEGIESEPLPESGDSSRLGDVERFPSQGAEHVDSGTEIDDERVPPLSGPHYASATEAGFYEETPPLGNLVHSLEHGAVVVYYDPGVLSPEAEESLRAFASVHTGPWQSVVVAPNPTADPGTAFVLTAWRTRLRMDSYDARTVRAFLAEYLGRGPENPVR
jgi:hypothetical protein